MLLSVVSLTGNVSSNDLAVRQAHSAGFTVCGIGFLGLQNHDTQHHAALERVALKIGGLRPLGLLALEQSLERAPACDLIQRGVPHLLLLAMLLEYPAGDGLLGLDAAEL